MVEFRSASEIDAPTIAGLHAKSWQQNYRDTFSSDFLDNKVAAERYGVWHQRLSDPPKNQFVMVAEVDKLLVGFVCAYIDDHPEFGALIDNLHVSSEFIGHRIGEQLMVKMAKHLSKVDERASMYLWVLASNLKAIKFYERLGGKAIETINDFDIGDREITKTRYHWPTLAHLLNSNNNE